MTLKKTTDFAALADKARTMTDAAIHYALVDIRKTLPAADALDRADGGDRGGRYRDEASVLYAERRARRGSSDPLTRLRYHVSGAIARGEKAAIVEVAAGRVPGATDAMIRDAEDRLAD